MGAAECKGCSTSDPTSDTVKVNPNLLSNTTDGKDASAGLGLEKDQSIEEQRLQREAEEQQEREAAAAAEEERQKRAAEEDRRRLEAEVEEQARLERKRAEECERIAREEQELFAREREVQERAAAEEEAARRAQQEFEEQRKQERLAAEFEEAKQKVGTFLKARGFTKGIAAAKKSCMKTSYPLHVAVEENSAEMITALLKCGADKAAKNSAGLTPLALAQKLDSKKKGSHSAVLAALA